MDESLEAQIAQLERQQSLQSEAIAALLADHYADGPNSSKGLLVQLNPERYTDLEVVEKRNFYAPTSPPPATNITIYTQPGTVAGTYQSRPQGIILHGSRSGQNWSIEAEFNSCRQYAANGAGGLGWTATVGPNAYSCHMTPRQYGWNARSDSSRMLAVEFAQARLGDPVTDAMVDAFVAWYHAEIVPVWGELDLSQDRALPTHAELSTGAADGKSDCFPAQSDGAKDVRKRIRERL